MLCLNTNLHIYAPVNVKEGGGGGWIDVLWDSVRKTPIHHHGDFEIVFTDNEHMRQC